MRAERPAIERPASLQEPLGQGPRQGLDRLDATGQPDPDRPRPAVWWKTSSAAELELDRRRGSGCVEHRVDRGLDARLERGTEEAQCQVQAVEADPADIAPTARDTLCSNSIDEFGDLGCRRIGKWYRDEQPASGQIRPGPARSRSAAQFVELLLVAAAARDRNELHDVGEEPGDVTASVYCPAVAPQGSGSPRRAIGRRIHKAP